MATELGAAEAIVESFAYALVRGARHAWAEAQQHAIADLDKVTGVQRSISGARTVHPGFGITVDVEIPTVVIGNQRGDGLLANPRLPVDELESATL